MSQEKWNSFDWIIMILIIICFVIFFWKLAQPVPPEFSLTNYCNVHPDNPTQGDVIVFSRNNKQMEVYSYCDNACYQALYKEVVAGREKLLEVVKLDKATKLYFK